MNLFKCEVCNNLVEFLESNGNPLTCCNQKMQPVSENNKDAASEKHVPIYEIVNKKIIVTVGEINHPMDKEHYINWIALKNDNKIIKKYLKPNDKPSVKFPYKPGSTIYAYCNLHGLFINDVK